MSDEAIGSAEEIKRSAAALVEFMSETKKWWDSLTTQESQDFQDIWHMAWLRATAPRDRMLAKPSAN